MERRSIYPVELEVRRAGRFSEFRGAFPYRQQATIRNKGRIRKERFMPGAFAFALQDTTREINLLFGHEYGRSLASRRAGTLALEDTDDALRFVGQIPDDPPTWVSDAVKAVAGGTAAYGISPGFEVPPRSVVPGAEELIPEPGNETVMIRQINDAILYELSIVSRAAYDGTEIEVRDDEEAGEVVDLSGRRLLSCL